MAATAVVSAGADESSQPVEEAGAPREPSRRVAVVLLTLLAAQFTALALHQAWNDAPTFDEMTYMSTGLASISDGELRQNHEAPFLPKAVHALPLRVAGVDVPLDGAWEDSATIDIDDSGSLYDAARLTDEFLELHSERGDLQRVVFIGRLMGVVEGVAIGLLLYALSAALFSRAAGLLAAGAWLTTPLAVGFGHLNSIDLAFTLTVVASALALVCHLRAPTWRTLSVLALAAGALQLARHMGFVYVVLICVVLVLRGWRRRRWEAARDVAVVIVATWALVWVAALAVAPTRVPVDGGDVEDIYSTSGLEPGPVTDGLSAAVDLIPWPAEYEAGFQAQLAVSGGENLGYLLGRRWLGTQPGFWPLSMLVKLPTTIVAMMLLGPFAWRSLSRDQRRTALLVAVLPTVVAFAFVLPFPKTLGIRYVLPGIAMLLVVASPLALDLLRRRAGSVVLGLGVIAQLVVLWTSVPHSLAWTAPPFRPGYWAASESNLDWGQDGYRLADWMDGRTAHVAYFGPSYVVDQLPGYRPLLKARPEEITGWVAVSATLLTTSNHDLLAYLRAYCNVGTIGGTILLYRFDEPPTPEPGKVAPAGSCDGPFSRRV